MLKTLHKNGIFMIRFSQDGVYVYSIGMDKNFRFK